jgi:hypothetical protein
MDLELYAIILYRKNGIHNFINLIKNNGYFILQIISNYILIKTITNILKTFLP